MAVVAVTDLTFAVTTEDSVTESGPGPSPNAGFPRAKFQFSGTRALRLFHGSISIPTSALTYPAGGIPISGVTSSLTGAVVAGNALACPGLGCPNEVVELFVQEDGADRHAAVFSRGVAGTSPHKLKLYGLPATPAATEPLAEVPDTTALNDATAFPAAAAKVVKVTVIGW